VQHTLVHAKTIPRALKRLQLNMGGGLTPEEAVLCGTERSNAARKRPTAVKRAVLKARATRAAAQAADDATARAGALAAAWAAAADVQLQYEVCTCMPLFPSNCSLHT
jgi:hypothetical protein